jgi:hypothetical protein
MLAVSWLLFMVALNFPYSLGQYKVVDEKSKRSLMRATKVLYLIDIGAVICVAVVIAAYVEVVGYVGLGLASYVALVVIFSSLERKG